ncbi:ribonuclease P protein component [Sediminivirga luteola]|uniref:Ribonuclease P protein component n=1 Tax=Sediminivirga luteola TaxID=1774748 RepID=A0A8J2XJI4_9MICO|nr:ribonuclease P protein component [Sediminivirga luteola]MCI2266626.1 ribonuclease P protein component [Sediminivirga luteola]GGA20198.1 ribonuclease P protein component [Sediminivirga luteola]
MLAREHRLRRPADFSRTTRTGRRSGGRFLVLYRAERPVDESHAPRVGFVVSRAVGNAVTRNRVKRRLRAIMHQELRRLPEGTDIVVRALPASASADFRDLQRSIEKALRRTER